jgi:signal transduction histidine kinase
VLPKTLDGDAAFPVTHREELLGAISVRMPRGEPLTQAGERLISEVASQAGLVLSNARLIEELRASRHRLVAAQDEERRRIERNIHDGAQQQLVALAVKLRLAESLVGSDDERARVMLDELQAETSTVVQDLRDLARGIYPPLLAERGLPAALEAQARKAAVPTTVEADGIGRFPQQVESAVYFSVLEALQNVAKYARATSAHIGLAADRQSLVFSITDDGKGFDPAERGYGTGLQGMADRLDAVGGRLEIRSAPRVGTTVSGSIPLVQTDGRPDQV